MIFLKIKTEVKYFLILHSYNQIKAQPQFNSEKGSVFDIWELLTSSGLWEAMKQLTVSQASCSPPLLLSLSQGTKISKMLRPAAATEPYLP